jgi:hypothetical protein
MGGVGGDGNPLCIVIIIESGEIVFLWIGELWSVLRCIEMWVSV